MPSSRRHFLGGLAVSVLPLPALAQTVAPDGFRVLEAGKTQLRLLAEPAPQTQAYGYDGTVPGPVLRVKQGDVVKLRFNNKLPVPSALHFQGLRLPNNMDGVPGLTQVPVPPGGSFDYSFAAPDAGTYLYRPSVLANQARQMASGLFGVLVVEDPVPLICDLELVLTLEDWHLDEKGTVLGAFNTLPDGGHKEPTTRLVTLNARPLPAMHQIVPGARIRLRLVNATIARLAAIGFEGARPMIIAIDGQNCAPFEPVRQTLPAAPGARFDVMLDMPGVADALASMVLRGENGPDLVLAQFKTSGTPRIALPPVASAPLTPRLPAVIRLQDARRLQIVMEPVLNGDANHQWKLNGVSVSGIPAKPLFSVKVGTPVQLGFTNKCKVAHVVHIHGHNIRLLHDLDDGWEPYWRDQLVIEPGRTHQIAFIADNPGKWLMESANLEHGNTGLAAWFEVT